MRNQPHSDFEKSFQCEKWGKQLNKAEKDEIKALEENRDSS